MTDEQKKTFPYIVATISLETEEDIKKTVQELELNKDSIDIVEFRADTLADTSIENINKTLMTFKDAYQQAPILFTYRSVGQGGFGEFDHETYYKLMQDMIHNKKVDYVDIQLDTYEDNLMNCITKAQNHEVKIIISHHDFKSTPDVEEMYVTFEKMAELGADIGKLAVMPQNEKHLLAMLNAMNRAYHQLDIDVIGISMGELGRMTRITGGLFGSKFTYGYVGKEAAPGQLHVKEIKEQLALYQK
ncbi:type I 3-dehydroquinate dehydratase [Mammaliicoccus sp. Dog046]|uniref:type I 3-dehydroquinate dehydratase n=1 Tax=Mammaliicoccus sp. Dog046 TaxID=3034233 RepID=UPI002B26197F|nr:type I 3-dehydroquinate dehydratase [Mammaliicoccus sp. Dog046]WQK84928.1 type I 3-dehydroquinate dehydratase [Mammaliicoccus sp. Dog046]